MTEEGAEPRTVYSTKNSSILHINVTMDTMPNVCMLYMRTRPIWVCLCMLDLFIPTQEKATLKTTPEVEG